MWVLSRPRSEHDVSFLLNLDMSSRIDLVQLGDRWFVEVRLGNEAVPVASASSREEAEAILAEVFSSLRSGATALDLGAPPHHELDGRTAPVVVTAGASRRTS